MKRAAIFLALSLTLSGCVLTSLNPFSSKPSVDISANVGKNVEQEKNNIKLEQGTTNTKQEAEKISNDTSYKADVVNQIANELTWWQLVAIIVLAGVALPSWRELGVGIKAILVESYKGLRFVITDLCSLVVVPIKGLGNYLLVLFGRDRL